MKRSKHVLKSVLSLLLVLAMTLALAACGGSGEGTKNQGESSNGGGTETDDKEGWSKLKVMGQVDQEFWDSRENQPVWQEFQRMLEEAKLDVEFVAITQEQYKTTLQTTLATGADMPDIVNLEQMDKSTAMQLGEQGVLVDVLPLVEQYSNGNIDKSINERLGGLWGTALTEQGSAFWVPFGITIKFADGSDFYSAMVPVVRADWVEKLNMEMPTNIEEFKDLMRAFREQDANENGQQDEIMIAFTKDASPFEMFGPLFGLPCEHVLVDTSDDVVKSPWLMKDQLTEYFKFFQEMTAEGILSKDAINQSPEYVLQQTKMNIVGAKNGFAMTDMYDGEVAEYGGAYRGVFPYAVSNEEGYIQAAAATSETKRMAITNACKDKEAAIRFLDILHSDEFTNLTSNGVEGVSYDMVDGKVVNKVYDDGLVFGSREYWLEGRIRGGELWLALLGGCQEGTGESNVDYVKSFQNYPYDDEIVDFVKGRAGDKYYFPGTYQLAAATPEESEREIAIMNDLKTYMDETAIKLAIGEYSIDDIDQYVNTMKEMGLEEIIAIRQAQHDRYIGK